MTQATITKWASIAAVAATTLFAAPSAYSEVGLKTQIKAQQFNNHRKKHNDDGRRLEVLRECGSSGYRVNRCHFDTGFRIVDAKVDDRKSNANCNRGSDWGLEGNTIWVRDGCRAIFKLSNVSYSNRHDRDYGYNDRRHGDHRNHDRHDPYRQGRDRDYGYDKHNKHKRISYNQERTAIGSCAREANREAYKYDAYSAQYRRQPHVSHGRKGNIRVTGSVRVHGTNGFKNRETVCVVGYNGHVKRFRFEH